MTRIDPALEKTGLCGTNGERVALLGVAVKAQIAFGHTSAVITQRYRNDEARPIEAIYTFPLPTNAAVVGFAMTVNGRRIDGEVKPREEAFEAYDDALAAGHGAALVDQERPNVFTASVGNLLPGEETLIELRYLERVAVDEGAVRWSLPTLVAPRYVPGAASGDRTAHGTAEPTDRVPDADRVSPAIGDARYGLSLELLVDLGAQVDLDVRSPSHPIVVTRDGHRARVTFAAPEVALDRDVVITAAARNPEDARLPLVRAVAHRDGDGTGTFALTLVPDLGATRTGRSDVVFLLDRSGSMEGPSITEARTALRLCLRQLREGDRFTIVAFDDRMEAFDEGLVPFTQATLHRADAWLSSVGARGGTELLGPVLRATALVPDGVTVLLTDGQVANEDEILARFLEQRGGKARLYSFGIGTNVSDVLLRALAERSGGAVEFIHPGERIDEKVVAQFARATARRVTDLKLECAELDEIAPGELPALVDGEPWTVFARFTTPPTTVALRGILDGEAFHVSAPVEALAGAGDVMTKLWARERIRELEHAALVGRRADAMKKRITDLAVTHGLASKHTSFVLLETRTGERRATAQPEARVVPVSAPAGWGGGRVRRRMAPAAASRVGPPARYSSAAMPLRAGAGMPPPPPPAPMAAPLVASRPAVTAPPRRAFDEMAPPPGRAAPRATRAEGSTGAPSAPSQSRAPAFDPVALLARQNAKGLWDDGDGLTATIEVLLALYDADITTAHAVFGAQVKKAIEALVARPRVPELALAVAWLLATGQRTKQSVEAALAQHGYPARPELEMRAIVARR